MLEHDYPPSLTKIRKRFLCKLGYHKWEPIRRINGQYCKICFGCASLTKIRKRFLCKLGYHKWEPIRRINGQYGKICFGCDPVKEWWEPLPSFRSKGSEVMSKQ